MAQASSTGYCRSSKIQVRWRPGRAGGRTMWRYRTAGHRMQDVAIGIFCKTPAARRSKTRLSPPLRPEECAAISACFIRDLSKTIAEVASEGGAVGYAIYTPAGTEAELSQLLPDSLGLLLQSEGEFGARLI